MMAAIAYSRGGEVLINCKSSGWNMFFQQREAKEWEKKEKEEWLLGFD